MKNSQSIILVKQLGVAMTYVTLLLLVSCNPVPVNVPIDNRIGSLPEKVLAPDNNPTTPEKVELGRLLFWDPVLSGGVDVACVTCHHPDNGYAENIDLSIGVGGHGLSETRIGASVVKRNAQTILNTAFNGMKADGSYDPQNTFMFWDNRSHSLEDQALQPILSQVEMRSYLYHEDEIINVVSERLVNIPEYVTLFKNAFGDTIINGEKIAKALAAFERTIIATNSRFDQYARGDDNGLRAEELRGMTAFLDANCVVCHGGPMFSDFELHDLGVPNNPKLDFVDAGENGKFRTPSLRNLSETGPYMHNGVFATLKETVEFYDRIEKNDEDAEQLDFDDSKANVDATVAFLRALNDQSFDKTIPETVPSGLKPGGNIEPLDL